MAETTERRSRRIDGKSPSAVRPGRWLSRAVFIIPALAYVLLILLGATTSNVGIDFLRQDPGADHGLEQIGGSQAVRSDEYGTESPIWLGQLAREGQEAETPLSVSSDFFAQLPAGPVSSVVFFDGTLLGLSGWLSEESLFAMKWWLPTLLLFMGLPVWFRQVTGRLRWGYLASVFIALAPASVWWSGRPVNTLGFVAAGCALALYGMGAVSRRQRIRAAAAFVVSGILLARLPSYYQPLAIIIGIPLVLATACVMLFARESLRVRLVSVGAVAVSGAFWTGASLWENRDAIVAGLSTVYPGDRQSTGEAMEAGRLFGATNFGWLRQLAPTALTFESELVTSFNVLFIALLVLVASARWRGTRAITTAIVPLAVLSAFWLSWAMVDWGSVGSMLPLINRVPAFRAVQGAGYLLTLVFCLFMAQWKPPTNRKTAVLAGVSVALFSAYGGSSLQSSLLPDLTTGMIWVSAIVAGAVVFAMVQWPHKWWALVAAGLSVSLLALTSTPVLFGLGDLRTSETAQKFLEWGSSSRSNGTVWAAESGFIDSLMTSTGTPSLSYRQQVGPDVDQWERLDPGGVHEDMWNRGGLHIRFDWTDDKSLIFSQPSPDVVLMTGSPCVVAERIPALEHIVADEPLSSDCLSAPEIVQWSGSDHYVYRVG